MKVPKFFFRIKTRSKYLRPVTRGNSPDLQVGEVKSKQSAGFSHDKETMGKYRGTPKFCSQPLWNSVPSRCLSA